MDNFLEDDDFLGRWVTWSLWALAIIVCIATVTGLVESYNGLYIWFATHHVTGFWADFAPLTVDSFTVIGELAIFAGISRHWDWKSRIIPWGSALLGICSSVAGNVGDKVQYHSIPTDLTGAIFPLAGAFGIIIGLGVLKRVAKDHRDKKVRQQAKPDDGMLERIFDVPKPVETVKERVHVGSAAWIQSPQIEQQFEGRTVADLEKDYMAQFEPMAGPGVDTLVRIRDQELKGLDVLIPPTQEEVPAFESIAPQREEAFSSWEGIVQPATGPMSAIASTVGPINVSREEARRRQSNAGYYKQITQTGEFAAVSD